MRNLEIQKDTIITLVATGEEVYCETIVFHKGFIIATDSKGSMHKFYDEEYIF